MGRDPRTESWKFLIFRGGGEMLMRVNQQRKWRIKARGRESVMPNASSLTVQACQEGRLSRAMSLSRGVGRETENKWRRRKARRVQYSRSQVKKVFQGERSNHMSHAPKSEVLAIDSSNPGIRFVG